MSAPAPLVPEHVDLSKLDGFMLDTSRLLGSELVALSSGDEFKAAVLLWCRAWKQRPAASLPNDDKVLAAFAGVSPSKWRKIKTVALRGFVECSDGRLYHPVLAADAIRAAEAMRKRNERTKAATEARKKGRDGERDDQRNVQRDDARNEVPKTVHREEIDKKDLSQKLDSLLATLGHKRPSGSGPNAPNYDDPAVRKARWQQKVSDELRRRLPAANAEAIIAGYAEGDPKCKRIFEEVSASMKARTAA